VKYTAAAVRSSGGLCSGRIRRGGNDLTHALMIEDGWSAVGTDEHRNASTDHQGLGVVDTNSIATDEFHEVRLERRAPLKSSDRCLEMLGRHDCILHNLPDEVRQVAFSLMTEGVGDLEQYEQRHPQDQRHRNRRQRAFEEENHERTEGYVDVHNIHSCRSRFGGT